MWYKELYSILGNLIIYNYILNLSNITVSDFFDESKGWYSNKEEIFTGIYNIVGEKKELSKYFEITEENSFISFNLELNLEKGEEFLIMINSNITKIYTNENSEQKNYFLNISLNIGENLIQLIYQKHLIFEPSYKNPVIIKNIIIRGSKNEYTERKLIPCGENEISFHDCSTCVPCHEDYIANKTLGICFKKENKTVIP